MESIRHRACDVTLGKIKGLGLLNRLCHHKVRKHTIGVGVGILIMFAGSMFAGMTHLVENTAVYFFIEGMGHFIHAIGAIPIIKHIEVVWEVATTEK